MLVLRTFQKIGFWWVVNFLYLLVKVDYYQMCDSEYGPFKPNRGCWLLKSVVLDCKKIF